mmetsp:Transcript_55762/g.147306  ORF Transcript_55762/g.147306 Transcript_55762/m.147306 type:complete len:299 (+) Transcript_55762:669-1565(+)
MDFFLISSTAHTRWNRKRDAIPDGKREFPPHLAQRGECCTDQLVVRPDNEVDEALLERHTTLASAVAHRRQRHAACLLAITLEEELVGYSHGPLLGNIEWLQHIRSVGAFDDDFHLELLVNLAVIGGGSRVRKSFQFGCVLSVSCHVRRQNVVEHHRAEGHVLSISKLAEKLDFRMQHKLERPAAMVIFQHRAVIVKSCKIRSRCDQKWIVDSRMFQIMAQSRNNKSKNFNVPKLLSHSSRYGQTVHRLCHVDGMVPVVVRIIKHTRSNDQNKTLQLVDGNFDTRKNIQLKKYFKTEM